MEPINLNSTSSSSQRMKILADLKNGAELTSLTMLQRYGAIDGRKRISELRRLGYPIKDRREYNTSTKKHYNIYFLEPEKTMIRKSIGGQQHA